jgi:hypothetical protein
LFNKSFAFETRLLSESALSWHHGYNFFPAEFTMLRSRCSLAKHANAFDEARSLVRQLAESSTGVEDCRTTAESSEIDALLARLTLDARRLAQGTNAGDLFAGESERGIGGSTGHGPRATGEWS